MTDGSQPDFAQAMLAIKVSTSEDPAAEYRKTLGHAREAVVNLEHRPPAIVEAARTWAETHMRHILAQACRDLILAGKKKEAAAVLAAAIEDEKR